MTRVRRNYARIYYNQLQHEFPSVYDDDALLGAYTRLLSVAERIWPSLPDRPVSVPAARWTALVKVGLIEPVGKSAYRVRGLDAERTRRSVAGTAAITARWDTDGSTNGNTNGVRTVSETDDDADTDGDTNGIPSPSPRKRPRVNETVDNIGRARPRRPRSPSEDRT